MADPFKHFKTIHKHIKIIEFIAIVPLQSTLKHQYLGFNSFLISVLDFLCFLKYIYIPSGFQYYYFYSSPCVTKFLADPKEKLTLSKQPRLQDLVY